MTLPATLYAALVPALGELVDVDKARTATVETKTGGSYKYSYAGLADVLAVVRPVLAGHGLAVMQPIRTDLEAGTVTVTTRILHTSGEELEAGRITFPLGGTAQTAGSAISYARRYAILAALGIAGADDDDDGQAASAPANVPPPRVRMVSSSQMKRIGALMDEAGVDRDDSIRRALVADMIGRTVKSRTELSSGEASTVIDALQTRIAEARAAR